MTSSTETNFRYRRPGGFTLIELLVSIAIIALILGILLPTLAGARKKAMRARMAMDLHGLSQALEAYRGDFRDYPRIDYTIANPIAITDTTYNPNLLTDRLGAVTLCWALLAPGPAIGPSNTIGAAGSDGADGPGFRVRGNQGQVYGPYILPGKYNITGTNDWNSTINDAHGNPYLYFPAFKGANISAANGFVTADIGGITSIPLPPNTTSSTTAPMFNFADNAITINNTPFTEQQMEVALGDTGGMLPPTPAGPNGMIDGAEVPATTGPFLLWGAGPDDAFGPPLQSNGTYGTSDDVTNFGN